MTFQWGEKIYIQGVTLEKNLLRNEKKFLCTRCQEKNEQKKEKKRHNTNEHWVICVLTFFD